MWKLRVYEPKKPGQRKLPWYDTEAHGPEDAAQALRNLMSSRVGVVRVDITSEDYEPDPAPPVKAQRLEWWQDRSYTMGERWEGTVGGELVASVVHHSAEHSGKCHYSVHLGPFGKAVVDVANVEAGKRAAQRALDKAVQKLLGEN
jgi:hypothetical protein